MISHTQIVGILNLTPDSFSDGGINNSIDTALEAANEMIACGVHVIDIGAESTRPKATPLSTNEEWPRLRDILPALIKTAHENKVQISIDTRHPQTADKALQLGADWINDVSGLSNPDMLEVVAHSDCRIVFMHSLSIPASPDIILPENTPLLPTLRTFIEDTIKRTTERNIAPDRLIFDPGLGFGKTALQSLEIIKQIKMLKTFGIPIFIGHSRKSFLCQYTPVPAHERDGLTLAVSEYLMTHQVEYIRVHNVPRHMELLALHHALHAPTS